MMMMMIILSYSHDDDDDDDDIIQRYHLCSNRFGLHKYVELNPLYSARGVVVPRQEA